MKNLLIFVIALIIGIGLLIGYKRLTPLPVQKIEKQNLVPTSHFSIEKAPSNSIQANIATFSGEVSWQSRIATEASRLTTLRKLQQGEDIITEATGIITLEFPNVGTVTLQPNTKLSLIQTLPTNVVLQQNSGSVLYEKTGNSLLSVHSLSLLIEQMTGSMRIKVNTDTDMVTVTVASGSAKSAYEDNDNTTQVTDIPGGRTLQFDSDIKDTRLTK